MTKTNMINEIAKKESELWLDYVIAEHSFVKEHFEFGQGYEVLALNPLVKNDTKLTSLRAAWFSVSELLASLGIEQVFDGTAELAFDFHDRTYKYLKGIK